MGNKLVTFSEEQLEHFQDCTFFTKIEILRVWKKYKSISPVNASGSTDLTNGFHQPREYLEKIPELRENPFRNRICEVFSKDGSGKLSFEEFLYMMSVFSDQAPRNIKVHYAFKIYDFDNDEHIGPEDITVALRLITRNELTPDEMKQVAEKIMDEADVDGDGKLSFTEFNHVVLKAPDFLSTFHIRT